MFMVSYWEHMDVINTINNEKNLTFIMMIRHLVFTVSFFGMKVALYQKFNHEMVILSVMFDFF